MRTLILTLILLTGCAASNPAGPPDIRYGEDECSRCRMIIGEVQYSAATRLGQEVRMYDDLGELFEQPLRAGEQAWVHDSASQEWIDARTATYVHCPGLKTPMAYSLLAFREPAAASLAAGRYQGGQVFTFDQMWKRD